MALTPMRERYCQEVASGKSQAAAYRIAYPKSQQWKDDSVCQVASRLSSNINVSSRIAELRAELAKESLWTRQLAVETLMGVIEAPDKQSDVIAAAKVLNEMHGYEAPKEIKHSGTIHWPVPMPKVEG